MAHPALDAAARMHSQDMSANGFLDHQGSDGSWPRDRTQKTGYPHLFYAENAAWAADPVQAWMESFWHRRNILHPDVREVGAGTAGTHHTTVFGLTDAIAINNDAAVITSRAVTLTIPLDRGWSWQRVTAIMVSDSPTFTGASWTPVTPTQAVIDDWTGPITYTVPLTMPWTLPAGVGERAVYVKYQYTSGDLLTGLEAVGRDTIWLAAPTGTSPLMPALPPAMREFQSPQQLGAGTFAYPLVAPGGLLPPRLRLHSSSFLSDEGRGQPAGILGSGTSLGGFAILRRPDTTPDQTADDAFDLLWDGVRWPLVYADPATGGDGFYHRNRELAGQTLTIQRDTPTDTWVITDTNGLTWFFGTTPESVWHYLDSSDAPQPYRWNLARVTDSHTNYQTWHYTTEPGNVNGVPFARGGYLTAIAWNGNTTLGQAPDRRLHLIYGDRGAQDYDPAADRFYLTQRLEQVRVEVGDQPIGDYRFSYAVLPDAGREQLLLTGITRYGTDGTTVLQTVTLGYLPPTAPGEGYHLDQVARDGTPRLAYTYARFAFHGVMRYRVQTVRWGVAAGSGAASSADTLRNRCAGPHHPVCL